MPFKGRFETFFTDYFAKSSLFIGCVAEFGVSREARTEALRGGSTLSLDDDFLSLCNALRSLDFC